MANVDNYNIPIYTIDRVGLSVIMYILVSLGPSTVVAEPLVQPQENLNVNPTGAGLQNQQEERNSENGIIHGQSETRSEVSEEPEQIVVTGSHIRGVGASAGSPVIVIDRQDLERSGYATTQQLVQSLPQNFGGGASEDTKRGSEAISISRRSGSGINLRGLGNVATLVLLNGRRLAGASDNGDIPDISLIPVGAIERIEILPDGASAVYGSDAVAGVVNFILRSDYEGAESRVRYGNITSGSIDEYQATQSFGANWSSGNFIIVGEFYHRGRLSAEDRSYAASSDLRPLGGNNWGTYFSVPGNILDPTTFTPILAIPHGQNGRNLKAEDLLPAPQINYFNDQQGVDLLARQRRYSLFSRINQLFISNVEIYGEFLFSQRKSNNRTNAFVFPALVTPQNPFYIDVFGDSRPFMVAYNFYNDYGPQINRAKQEYGQATVGAKLEVSNTWGLSSYATYARNTGTYSAGLQYDSAVIAAALVDPNPDTALNVFGDIGSNNPATIRNIFSRRLEDQRTRLSFWNLNAVVDGTLLPVAGGDVKVGIGTDVRWEKLNFFNGLIDQRHRRRVLAAFGEILIPIVGKDNSTSYIRALEASVSIRAEKYKDLQVAPLNRPTGKADTVNPKFGINWEIVHGFAIHASYGTAFRAPSLPQKASNSDLTFGSLRDPMAPTGRSLGLYVSGIQQNISNEKSRNWTVGVKLNPEILPNLSIQAAYYNIRFKDRISGATLPEEMLRDLAAYGDFVVSNPAAALVQQFCASSIVRDGATAACINPGIVDYIFDLRIGNRAVYVTKGIDGLISYVIPIKDNGQITISSNANYILQLKQSPTASSPSISILNTFANPVDFRARGSINWSTPFGLSVSVFGNYTDSYRDNLSMPERNIKSYFTLDLNTIYNTGDKLRSMGLSNIDFSVAAINIFNKKPPFVNVKGGYDPENSDPIGRQILFSITKRW